MFSQIFHDSPELCEKFCLTWNGNAWYFTPSIVEKEGKLFLIADSPGGSTIPTSVYQVITNVIDFVINISEAVDAVRFHHQ